jgi:TATA-binding protein-associated factor Taf7
MGMADSNMDRELDETLEKAKANLEVSEKLIDEAEAAREEFAAWRGEHGISEKLVERFNASLSEEDRQRAAAEREEWERQFSHDLAAAVALARPKPKPVKARQMRSYI